MSEKASVLLVRHVSILSILLAILVTVKADFRPSAVTFESQLKPLQKVPKVVYPPVNLKQVEAEDIEREKQGLPLRFAIPNTDLIKPSTHGIWEEVGKGLKVWRIRIQCPAAKTLNFGFTKYSLPPGGRLFIYSDDMSSVIRPFTDADNKSHGQLWTPTVPGNTMVIEVTVREEKTALLDLELTKINVGYRGFRRERKDQRLRSLSGSCNVDVVCSDGDDWHNEIPSAGLISTDGYLTCSGGMVNNADSDQTPLFLTAAHCGVNSGNAASLVVYWNYETTTCGGPPDGSLDNFQTGSTHLASYAASDFTLVRLNSSPDPSWGVTFAGWDRSGATPISAVAIHHPSVDEKRISFENDQTSITSWYRTASPGDGTHIRVADWDLGTTEGGSSGSHLFDQNHRVVGQLHGGDAACGNDLADWYGFLSRSWTGGGTPATRLSDWLDPSNTGVTTTDTLVPAALPPTGGCCTSLGCSAETEDDCLASQGTYLGDDVSCTSEAGIPTTYSASPLAIPIQDNSVLSHTITVPDSFTIADVDIDVDVTHTWVEDLQITISHGGITMTVVYFEDCSSDNFDISLNDEGPDGAIQGQCVSNLAGDYKPVQSLSGFDGMDASGDWTISISDNASQDQGTLNAWAVRIDGVGPSPCFQCEGPADCDDGLYCNGQEQCTAQGACQPGSDPCPGQSCDEGSDTCFTPICNNDGTCDPDEDCNNCPNDCIFSNGPSCGNDVCEPGEDCINCPSDCRGRQSGGGRRQYCCNGNQDAIDGSGRNPINCIDSRCTANGFSCSLVSTFCCGDGTCEGVEDVNNCALDCGCTGDGDCPDDGVFCNGAEFCGPASGCVSPGDPCGQNQICIEASDSCEDCRGSGASCPSNDFCCSRRCKNNGTCR